MKNKIAFFDFDGTLTKKDSLTEFYKYVYEDTFVFNYHLRNILTYLLVRLGILNYLSLKMKRLRFLVRKVPKPMLNEKSAVFFEKFMKNEWKKEGEKEIMQLKEKGFDIVIVSASVDLLLLNLQDNMDVKIITNQLEILDENYTGRFLNE